MIYRDRFRYVVNWLKESECPGPMICPATFADNWQTGRSIDGHRVKELVGERSYIVCESDTLSIEVFGRVIFYLTTFLTLRAVVHTGGKSIHCWFDYPRFSSSGSPFNARRELHAILEGLGCDPAMFGWASTARLPGCRRADKDGTLTDQWQRLIYLNPKYPVNL